MHQPLLQEQQRFRIQVVTALLIPRAPLFFNRGYRPNGNFSRGYISQRRGQHYLCHCRYTKHRRYRRFCYYLWRANCSFSVTVVDASTTTTGCSTSATIASKVVCLANAFLATLNYNAASNCCTYAEPYQCQKMVKFTMRRFVQKRIGI
jgi:hypothetical protein